MLEDIADNPWVVLTAYLAVFFPWTAIASTDFLGQQWKSVAKARQDGSFQLFFVAVPTSYIIFYIYVQLVATDFKEAFAAVVGLIFSLLHLARTVWGLWQLREFRRWALRAIYALKFAGIEYRLNNVSEKEAPEDLVDRILINDSIADNQLHHGSVRCYLRYGAVDLRLESPNESQHFLTTLFARVKLFVMHMIFPVHWLISWLLVLISSIYSVRLESPTQFQQVPTEPVDLWLNWATAFASQGLGAWIEDVEGVTRHPDQAPSTSENKSKELYDKRRAYFAQEVLAGAVLQLGRAGTGKNLGCNPMFWDIWDDNAEICSGRVSKQELFWCAVKAGDGLPFEAPQHDLLVNRKVWSSEISPEEQVGYGPYGRKLQRVVESMPAAFGAHVERFDVPKLEWLTIFLYIGTVGNRYQAGDGANSASLDDEFQDSGTEHVDGHGRGFDDADLAFNNLRLQLGFHSQASLVNGSKIVQSFPFNLEPLTLISGTNRLVLQVAELTDIWLALVSGDRISFLKEVDNCWEDLCLIQECERENSMALPGGTNYEEEVSFCDHGTVPCHERLRGIQAAVAKAGLECQYAREEQYYAYMDQTLTFMGYDMEYVRTELARWVSERAPPRTERWAPKIPYRLLGNFMNCEPIVLGMVSPELSRRIITASRPSYLQRRAIHVRVIWEIRAHLQDTLAKKTESPSSLDAMILCVLAFPSLTIDLKEDCSDEGFDVTCPGSPVVRVDATGSDVSIMFRSSSSHTKKAGRQWVLSVYPECAPQRLFVEARLCLTSPSQLSVEVSLCRKSCSRDERFNWESWRDSFTSRLKAVEDWQIAHNMIAAQASYTTSSISEGLKVVPVALRGAGENLKTWSGWTPFRFGFVRAELLSPNFVTELGATKKMRIQYHSNVLLEYIDRSDAGLWTAVLDLRDRVPVLYAEAQRESLCRASIVVREVMNDKTHVFDNVDHARKDELALAVISYAEKQICQNPHEADRSLVLLEIAAVELGSTQGLKRLVELLTNGLFVRKDTWRAVDVIERCVAVYLGRTSWSKRGSVTKVLGKRAEDFRSLYNFLIRTCSDDERVFSSYGRWMIMTIGDCDDLEIDYVRARIREALLYTRSPSLLMSLASLTGMQSGFVARPNYPLKKPSAQEGDTLCKDTSNPPTEFFPIQTTHRLRICLLEKFVKEGRKEAFWKNTIDVTCTDFPSMLASNGRYSTAHERLRKNYASGLYNLGNMLRYGVVGVEKNSERAVALYRQAVANGEVEAMNNLAIMLVNGEGVAKDPSSAVRLYKEATYHGDLTAAYNLALLFMEGADGIARDAQQAVRLYEKAIEAGSVDAMTNLAMKLFHGDDRIERNPRRAVALYERAIAESGDAGAMFNLATSLLKGELDVAVDAERAHDLYVRAIEVENHVESMYNLANLLVRGAEGVEKDCKRAVELYERAIDCAGHQDSLHNLGLILRDGAKRVPKDIDRAAELFQRAVTESGHPGAMFKLATLFGEGLDGLERNTLKAVRLYERLIRGRRHFDAMFNLAHHLWFPADGVEGNPQEAVSLLEQVIEEKQDPSAMYNLANFLWDGKEEVLRNRKSAMHLYERAINEGQHINAMIFFAQSISNGVEGYPKDVERAVQLYERVIEKSESVVAMRNLAMLLENGSDGVTRDVPKAVELYDRVITTVDDVGSMIRLAGLLSSNYTTAAGNVTRAVELYERAIAKENDVTAMINLAVLLLKGSAEVPRNPHKAVLLYRTAIEREENVTAMVNLSILLREGRDGIEKNVEESIRLLEVAIGHGDTRATSSLATILRSGCVEDIPRDFKRAASLYEKAAFTGRHVGSMVALALMYWEGIGIDKDMKKAVELFEMATQEGDMIACSSLGFMLWKGCDGVEQDEARAAKLFDVAISKGTNTVAMHALACLLQEGATDVKKDVKRAVELHRQAVHDGSEVQSMQALLELFANNGEAKPYPGEVESLRTQLDEAGQ